MNQSSWTHLGSSFTLATCLLTLFLLPRKASSAVDPQFVACRNAPKTCGNGTDGLIVIKYPFYIKDLSESYCGYPGFEVACNGNPQPVLKVSGDDDYVIHQINYYNQTLRVSNVAFSASNSTLCASRMHNLTLPAGKFEFGPYTTNATVLFNCSSSDLPRNLSRYEIGACSSRDDSERDSVLAMAGNDSKWVGNASEECGGRVLAPVDLGGGEEAMMARLRSGFVLKWTASNCSVCETSGGKCGFDVDSYHFQCFCPDRPHAKHCVPDKNLGLKLGLGLGFGISIAICLVVCYVIISAFPTWRKYSHGNSMMFWERKPENFKNIELFLENFGSLHPNRFSYSDIKQITNSFKYKLGEGGFGGVYRGKLRDGRLVAVKVLNNLKGSGEDFINEVSSISRTSHINVVTLLGFCFEGRKRALVYEFMSNGSLEKFIYQKSPMTSERQLNWETLYQIAIGIARGLEYLHRGCNTRILHFDIKPHNILLDEEFIPKISDFGLAKICPQKESIVSMLGARGTPGYIAPEVFSRNFGGVSHKSDVYSYGMMVLEMVGGRRNIDCEADRTSELYFPHWIYKRLELSQELGLQGIVEEDEKEKARKMIIVSMWCIQTNPSNRPPMSRVVEMLEGGLNSLQIPPQPFLSSPSRSPAEDSPFMASSSTSVI